MPYRKSCFLVIVLFLLGNALGSDIEAEIQSEPWGIVFINKTKKTVRLLRPLDGSEFGGVYPHYKFTVTNQKGDTIPLPPRCGLFGVPESHAEWQQYIVTIEPGQRKTIAVTPPQLLQLKGTYKISYEYIFPASVTSTYRGAYPDGLWRGTIEANPITVVLKKGR